MKYCKSSLAAILAALLLPATALEFNPPGTTVVPTVKSSVPLSGKYKIPADFRVKAPEKCEMALEMLGEALKTRGAKLTSDANTGNCVFAIVDNGAFHSPEAYTIIISPDGIRITAASDRGLFYAAQTLIPMIRGAKDNFLACQRIDDHPDLQVRGMHLTMRWLNSQNMADLKRLVRALASLKYNTLLLEFADNFPYEDNPFIYRDKAPEGVKKDPHFSGYYKRPGYTVTREELTSLTNWIRAHKIAIIPQIQLATHVRALATHPRFMSFLEAPPKLSSYHDAASCPSNDEVNELFKKMIREQLEFFKPEVFDLCFDEFDLVPFRVCPKCKARKPEEILSSLFNMAADVIFAGGAVPQICHDTFLPGTISRGEAALPHFDRRTIISYWSYVERPKPAHQSFKDLGFRVITMPLAGDPANTATMTGYARNAGLRGTIMTFWHHWHHRGPRLLPITAAGHGGFIPGAELCWNPGRKRELLPCEPVHEMLFRLGTPDRKIAAPGNWKPLPLAGSVNAELGINTDYPVFNSPGKLAALKKAAANAPEKFELITNGNKYYGILLAGYAKDPNDRRGKLIGVNAAVKEFAFLLTTARPLNTFNFSRYGKYGAEQTPEAAKITIHYQDKSRYSTSLRYRSSIIDWASEMGGLKMRQLQRSTDDRGIVYSFGVTRVANPHPEKVVSSIVFSTLAKDGLAPLMLAASVISDQKFQPQKVDPGLLTVKGAVPQPRLTHIYSADRDGVGKVDARLVISGPPEQDFPFANRKLKTSIAFDPAGAPVLRFTVPAIQKKGQTQRVIIRVPVKNISGGDRSISWSFKNSEPAQQRYYGIYLHSLENNQFPHMAYFCHEYLKKPEVRGEISFADMRRFGFKDHTKTREIWLSLWIFNDKPVTIDLYQISTSNQDGRLQNTPMYSDVLDRD